jgi:hypothetical protein
MMVNNGSLRWVTLLLLLFFLPFTWGRHRRARATTALPGATSLELLILFAHERAAGKNKHLTVSSPPMTQHSIS